MSIRGRYAADDFQSRQPLLYPVNLDRWEREVTTIMERRQFARISIHSEATIRHDKAVIMGVVENLSMKGAFVKTAETFPVNDPVTVTIYNYSTPNLLCDLQAKVVRVSETGMGLQFEKTLLD
jgi:hypothetical protein